ncbi:uncharacterized protein LOC123545629 [Mercenaria mercenaria]|uniref:uncharacterized protein LOC123545629 n=1 Tax=Mercenaria mercenaria TaxID=6596 RepID=UPI001E1DD6C9|nr:uncharacterized protein LOC123545629 [Mercenaria mercenaria]
MGLRIVSLNVFLFITVFTLLLQDFQVECRGGGRGGSRGSSRGYRGGSGAGGGSSGGSGGDAWWIVLAVFGGIFLFVAIAFLVHYIRREC